MYGCLVPSRSISLSLLLRKCYRYPQVLTWRWGVGGVSVSVSASYCIPQCVRLIAGVCTHYVVYNISKKKNTVDKSKIKER